MTLRVKLNLEPDETPDADWLAELLAWDLSHVAGVPQHARCVAMIVMVASRYPSASASGLTAWPTLQDLGTWLRAPILASGGHDRFGSEVLQLLTVAMAAGWLVLVNDDGQTP